MKRYELNLLLNPSMEEAALLDFLGALVSFIQEKGGLLETQDIRGKKPFRGAGKHREAMLAALTFSLNPDSIGALNKRLEGESLIIRSMLMEAPVRPVQRPKQAPVMQQPAAAMVSSNPQTVSHAHFDETQSDETKPAAVAQEQEKPVDLSEIDKKLEEIFKEN